MIKYIIFWTITIISASAPQPLYDDVCDCYYPNNNFINVYDVQQKHLSKEFSDSLEFKLFYDKLKNDTRVDSITVFVEREKWIRPSKSSQKSGLLKYENIIDSIKN